ncbi:MAG: exodeoxyribonuclease V alpha subunit [Planctomycetota bacterium]|jgi:exodeoxyribonuclease V alpha subunit
MWGKMSRTIPGFPPVVEIEARCGDPLAVDAPQDRSAGHGDEVVLQGTIDRVTFRAPDTGYTVLRVSPEQGFGDPEGGISILGERVSAVGTSPEISEGLRVRLYGHWLSHPTHGRQMSFERVEVLPPLDRAGLVRYLSSSTFNGIGPTLAERIVEALGPGALGKLREDPGELAEVKGLRPNVREELVTTIRAELGSQELFAFLLGLGLSGPQADAAARKFGRDGEEAIRADPYCLSQNVAGIGFKTADNVARGLGVPPDAPERRRAAALHALREGSRDGHSCLAREPLRRRIEALISREVGGEELLADLLHMEAKDLVAVERELGSADDEGPFTYLPHLHGSETRLAANLAHLLESAPVRALADPKKLARAEERAKITLHADQRAAVLGLLSNPVALLTGGPGVGKTTIVQLVVNLAEEAGAKVLLASPTGRAAKRLAEVTGRDASTVHRLLGWDPSQGNFTHRDTNPLETDIVVVDEISMLDVVMAHHLVKAIQPPTRLVFVGDPDQLPAVGAGNVLADLLKGNDVPAFRLTQIYRQAQESLIVTNAHRILSGQEPLLPTSAEAGSDFFLFPAEDEQEAAKRLVDVVSERIPRRFGLNWVEDVQVLSPMYRGACGVDNLNAALREALGVGGRELAWRGRVWRVGDRVIHTKNDYEREVFNGDMGRVVHINADGSSLTVRFPERELVYSKDQFAELQPAFAITVHRAQGCEFPCVVIPLVTGHMLMLQRHLLYTAVTRAKKLVVLVGQRRALRMAVQNATQAHRTSLLNPRLHALVERRTPSFFDSDGD